MTRIDFYVLPEADVAARQRFACRLAHRAWQAGHRVYLNAGDSAAAAALNALLWEYPRHRFVPHAPWRPATDPAAERLAPIHIGAAVDPADHDDVLINLAEEVPTFFARFARVAEVVVQEPAVRSAGRGRFKFYRERGYPLHHHDMQAWADD